MVQRVLCDSREDGKISSDSSSRWEGEVEAVGQGEFLERSWLFSFGSIEDGIGNCLFWFCLFDLLSAG